MVKASRIGNYPSMPELPVRTIIQSIAKTMDAELLKNAGYKKSGLTWLCDAPWTRIINLQVGKWNTPAEGTFTINLGLFIPELHAATESTPVTGSIKEYDCDVRRRIGELMPAGMDYWWKVTSTTDSAAMAKEVCQALLQHGMPWLDQTGKSLSDVAHELQRQASHSKAAVAFALAGDLPSATDAMSIALANCNPLFIPKLRRLAERHGISIPN